VVSTGTVLKWLDIVARQVVRTRLFAGLSLGAGGGILSGGRLRDAIRCRLLLRRYTND